MEINCNQCGRIMEVSEIPLTTETILCNDCEDEINKQNYAEEVRWQENMNSLYHWDDGGFCNGFTMY